MVTVNTSQGHLREAATDARPLKGTTTDVVVATFLRRLKEQRADVAEVWVSLNHGYFIYTAVESKSDGALDRVYKAEQATQKEFWKHPIYGSVVLIFEHRNRSLEGPQVEDEFLDRGNFIRLV